MVHRCTPIPAVAVRPLTEGRRPGVIHRPAALNSPSGPASPVAIAAPRVDRRRVEEAPGERKPLTSKTLAPITHHPIRNS